MPAYTPTTWVNDSVPPISAANLNNMESGIDAGNQAIDGHVADLANPHEVTGVFVFSAPDTLIVGSGKGRLKLPFAIDIVDATLTVGTAGTGADVIFDIHKDGTTIYSTQANRPKVADGSQDGTATTPDTTACAAGSVLTVDTDQVGSSTAGADATLIIRYTETD